MKSLNVIKENKRFALAIIANIFALMLAIYWLIHSNFLSDSVGIELEPIVTSITLMATLLGLNYVNDKLTRPDIRFHISMAIAQPPMGETMIGISIDIQNHSIQKLFISSFNIQLIGQDKILAIVRNGFSKVILGKIVLEPGQAFNLIIDKETIIDAGLKSSDIGDLIVTDQVGRKYISPAKIFRSHVNSLLNET